MPARFLGWRPPTNMSLIDDKPDAPILVRHLPALIKAITNALATLFGARDARITALEAKVKQLEESQPRDKGVWKSGIVFRPGDITTYKNNGWVCTSAHYSVGDKLDPTVFRLFDRGAR